MTTSSLATVSLAHDNGFLGLRFCAQYCVAGLADSIGCLYPDYNICYCNSNIIPGGSSFISTCVTSHCSESADISTAFAVWTGYCESAGFPMTAPAQATEAATTATTGGAVIGATTEAPTANGRTFTSLVSVTATNISNTQTTTESKLNIGAIVGGVLGLVIVLGIVAVAITMLILRDRRQRRFESQPATQPMAIRPPPVYPRDSEVDQRISKTPVMLHATPVYAGDRIESGHELDGRTATGAEMEGVVRLTRPEMQG